DFHVTGVQTCALPIFDLNADLGEGYGRWQVADEEALLPLVSSASIACGFHAGDPVTMRGSVRRAAALGVCVGAHPGYPDLLGFEIGRASCRERAPRSE